MLSPDIWTNRGSHPEDRRAWDDQYSSNLSEITVINRMKTFCKQAELYCLFNYILLYVHDSAMATNHKQCRIFGASSLFVLHKLTANCTGTHSSKAKRSLSAFPKPVSSGIVFIQSCLGHHVLRHYSHNICPQIFL